MQLGPYPSGGTARASSRPSRSYYVHQHCALYSPEVTSLTDTSLVTYLESLVAYLESLADTPSVLSKTRRAAAKPADGHSVRRSVPRPESVTAPRGPGPGPGVGPAWRRP